jgi:uncharacterized membrane protein YbhN (UPF0104 family)
VQTVDFSYELNSALSGYPVKLFEMISYILTIVSPAGRMPAGMNFARFYMNAKIKTTEVTKITKKNIKDDYE